MSRTLGAYTLLAELGQGGMGTVWRGRHRSDAVAARQGGEVAIKVLRADLARRTEFQERFVREADLGVRLDHPNITKVFDLVQDGGTLGLVMELVQGQELAERIGEVTGPIPWERAKPLFEQLAAAMRYAHAHGVVHRDLKPANVMVDDTGHVKVLDFGIAKEAGNSRTRTGTGMGTVDYMAPEQYTDAKNVDHRADIYALGMTLYEMLAGRLPWAKGTTEFEVLTRKNDGDLPPPTDFYPYIPAHVVAAIERATARQQADRFESVDALLDALDQQAPAETSPPERPTLAPEIHPDPVPLVQKPVAPAPEPAAPEPPAPEPKPAPEPAPEPRSSKGWIAALVGGGLVVVCCGGLGVGYVQSAKKRADVELAHAQRAQAQTLVDLALEQLELQKTDLAANQSDTLLWDAVHNAEQALQLDPDNAQAPGVLALASVWAHRWHWGSFDWDPALYQSDVRLVESAGTSDSGRLAAAIFWDNVCEHAPDGSTEAARGCREGPVAWDQARRQLADRNDWLEVEGAWNQLSFLNRQADTLFKRYGYGDAKPYWTEGLTLCQDQKPLLASAPVNDRELAQECLLPAGGLQDYDAYYFWARRLWADDLADKNKLTLDTRQKVFRRAHTSCWGAPYSQGTVTVRRDRPASEFCTHVGRQAFGCVSLPWQSGDMPWDAANRAYTPTSMACPSL